MSRKGKAGDREPVIENRRARHDYAVGDTLECGMRLLGTEVKSIRNGKVSLQEGYVRATEEPPRLELVGVHIAEYENASAAFQHNPVRTRELLAWKREIRKLAQASEVRGTTLVPLKIYFKNGRAKILIGIAQGRRRSDKRQELRKQEARREIDRALSKRV